MVAECKSVAVPYKCCHMVEETCTKQVPLHGLQAGALHQDDPVRALRAEASRLHGDSLRAEGGLQGGAGAGVLPVPLRAIVRLRGNSRGLGRKSDLRPEWRGDRFGPSTAVRFARAGPLFLLADRKAARFSDSFWATRETASEPPTPFDIAARLRFRASACGRRNKWPCSTEPFHETIFGLPIPTSKIRPPMIFTVSVGGVAVIPCGCGDEKAGRVRYWLFGGRRFLRLRVFAVAPFRHEFASGQRRTFLRGHVRRPDIGRFVEQLHAHDATIQHMEDYPSRSNACGSWHWANGSCPSCHIGPVPLFRPLFRPTPGVTDGQPKTNYRHRYAGCNESCDWGIIRFCFAVRRHTGNIAIFASWMSFSHWRNGYRNLGLEGDTTRCSKQPTAFQQLTTRRKVWPAVTIVLCVVGTLTVLLALTTPQDWLQRLGAAFMATFFVANCVYEWFVRR